MATRYIRYPTITAGGGGGSEQALSPNGGPLPAEIKVVGGYDGTDVRVLSTNTSGVLNVTAYQGGTWTISGGGGGGSIATDIFGTAVVTSRYNQLEINFETLPSSSLITNTTASGGSVAASNGHTLYSTSTNANGSAKGVSVQSVTYRPGAEVYSYFTVAFTTPTSAASYQRIGIYDTNNGFFIGYSGTTFGVTLRTGGADTFTARASWNGDPLNGSSTSQFTRAGVPEAINFTYTNVYRIRFGWLGSANIIFEVLSPDETWVVFNTIRIPNSQLNPSIQNPNLPMTIDVKKTASDATNLVMATGCWAAGASTNVQPITTTLTDNSLATLSRSVITGYSSSGGGSYHNVKVTPSGALTIAVGDITGIVGQQTMANSIPVVIASNQSAVPVSGSVTVSGTVAATQSGTWNINNISGTVSLPTGAATEATLLSIDGKVPSGLTVTSTRLLVDGSGVTQPISGSVSVSNFPATQPVSGTVAATQSGTWAVGINDISSVAGQKTMANSFPVVIASNQSAIPASQSGTWSSRTQDGSGNNITSTYNGALLKYGLDVSLMPNATVGQAGNWFTRTQDGSGTGITSTPNVPAGKNSLDVNVANTVLTVVQSTATNLNVSAAQSGNWSTRTQDGSGNTIGSTSNALDINIKSSNITFNGPGGRTSALLYRNVYSTSNVGTATYVVISASLPSNVNIIDIFDSSGQTMVIATGGAGVEVQKAYIYPGGPGQIPLAIAAGTRVVYRAVSGTAVSGEINMTFYT